MQNNILRTKKIIRIIGTVLLSGRLASLTLYHLLGYVINLPCRSFILDMLALMGIPRFSLEDLIIKFKVREYKISPKCIPIIMLAVAYGCLFVYPSYIGMKREAEKQRFDFNEYGLVLETEYGYDITFGDTLVYLKERKNFLFSKVLARIRFMSNEHNELTVYLPESDEIIVEYYNNGKQMTITLSTDQACRCY